MWSVATGAGGLAAGSAAGYLFLLVTRCFVGVGEGAYGPLAPSILSDSFPVSKRGKILSYFYVAMPVGGALGYALGDIMRKLDPAHESWRWAFYAVVVPGIVLTLLSLLMREPPKVVGDAAVARKKLTWQDCRVLFGTPSFVLNTLGMTAMAFSMGALAFWMPAYLKSQPDADLFGVGSRTVFGEVLVLAGLGGTLLGGALGDWLRPGCPAPISSYPPGG